jgi:hypothetical protein
MHYYNFYWVTIHNTRSYYIRRRRVPLAEGYSLISENLHIAYANETERSSVEVTPAPSHRKNCREIATHFGRFWTS